VPHNQPPTVIIPTKSEVDMTILCQVSVVAADTLRDLGLLNLNSGHMWQVMRSIPPPSLKILCLGVLDLRIVMCALCHHRQYVCSHCAYAISHDPCI